MTARRHQHGGGDDRRFGVEGGGGAVDGGLVACARRTQAIAQKKEICAGRQVSGLGAAD